jgi:hypothetical protein
MHNKLCRLLKLSQLREVKEVPAFSQEGLVALEGLTNAFTMQVWQNICRNIYSNCCFCNK